MFITASKMPGRVLGGVALASFAAVAAALLAQHGFKVKPCAWCVMQRGIFLLIGAIAALAWLMQANKPARKIALGLVILLAIAGIASAVFQHQVASQMDSCAMTVANQIINELNLEERLPYVFMITATCAEAAAYKLLGLPYEIWSGLLFAGMALVSFIAIRKR